MKKEMWEILVPASMSYEINNNRLADLQHHKAWDKKVSKIIGGVTILEPLKGRWAASELVIEETMIPVRIVGTREQIYQIVDLTLKHYDQKSVLAYKISGEVILRERDYND